MDTVWLFQQIKIYEFLSSTTETYFLTLGHDGDGFDFIANYKNHPYKYVKIVVE